MYSINGLEYLGRPVVIKGKEGKTEAKRFVTLKKMDTMPTKEEVIAAASEKPEVKRVWVMQMDGNKWKKVFDTIKVNS